MCLRPLRFCVYFLFFGHSLLFYNRNTTLTMGGHGYMGWWGHLGSPTQRGIVSYILSPFEQKPFAGALHNAVFNTSRRVVSQVPYVGVAFGLGYFIYSSTKSRHAYLTSKAGHAEAEDH